ncbi:MAG: hypothetical protein ACTSRZ_06425 [Promethearchaeota archaeon]
MENFFNRFMMKEDLTVNTYFKKLVNEISNIAGLAVDMVNNLAKDTLYSWEKIKLQDITELFYMDPAKRLEEINDLLKFFNKKIEKAIPSKELVEISTKIADQNLKSLFHVDRISISQNQ